MKIAPTGHDPSPRTAGPQTRGWIDAAAVYRDRRVLLLTFLGFASGLPFGVLADPLTAWLAEAGCQKTEIGLFSLIGLPYALKVVWAPFADRLPLPGLGRRFGRRRSWALATQAVLIVAIAGLGATEPATGLAAPALLATLAAFASASQDVVLDAYRVESLDEERLAAGAATMVFGWRLGQVGAAAGGLVLADLLPWPLVLPILAGGVGVGVVAILVAAEPEAPLDASVAGATGDRRWLTWLRDAALRPLVEFFGRPGWLPVLMFILLYKFGDAVLSVMKIPFFLELGFSKTEIAEVVKLFGVVAIVVGGFLGGVVMARFGMMTGLLVCGMLMAVSNLVFVGLAAAGPVLSVLALTIAVENVTTGLGTTAFVAYLSSLCNHAYTATQYALLTSLMALSRTVLSSAAGWVADQVDWATFFVITTLAALPGLVLLVWMMRRFPLAARPSVGAAVDLRDPSGAAAR
jgi:PAT family beta-lactamase induction signal transducer AmpG